MRELRRCRTEGLEDEQMLKSVGEVILAADDVADAEIGVVDAGGEVVSGESIGTKLGEVFDLGGELGLLTVDAVSEAESAVLAAGDTIAEGEGLTGGGAVVRFFRGQFAHAGVEEPGALTGGLVFIRRAWVA